jgi:hypothetical protein
LAQRSHFELFCDQVLGISLSFDNTQTITAHIIYSLAKMRISVTFLVVGSLFRSVLSSEGNGVATSSHATATAECKDLDDTIQCREWAWHGEW